MVAVQRLVRLLQFTMLVLCATGCAAPPFSELEGDDPGECGDGADNDRDLLFDCDDPDCASSPLCNPVGDDDDSGADDDDDTQPPPSTVSVLLLYDDSGPWGQLGKLYASQILGLLGHFPEAEVHLRAMDDYTTGLLKGYEAVIYIASTWNAEPAPQFEDDFWNYDGRFAWLGYNFWHLNSQRWSDTFGFSSQWTLGDIEDPQFYQPVRYTPLHLDPPQEFVLSKQEALWDPSSQSYEFDPFLQEIQIEQSQLVDIHATIEHSASGDELPYVVQSQKLWFFADIPFSFIHDGDRFLVFTDLLHDIVGIEHAPTQRALFRLEDVHPLVPPSAIGTVAELLWDRDDAQRPWSMALVPEFHDPLGVYADEGFPSVLTMNEDDPTAAAWREAIEGARVRGGSLLQHGTTHQYGDGPNPINGLTGTDSEFWLETEGTPVPDDSATWFTERVERGQMQMLQQGWIPFAFEYPHYQGSLLDSLILPDLYSTVYHRTDLMDFEVLYEGESYDVEDFASGVREELTIDWDLAQVSGEGQDRLGVFYPYFVAQDPYGQQVLPENLGNIAPEELVEPELSDEIRRVSDVLELAALNRSQRCAYASFFYHAFLVETDYEDAGGVEGITSLVDGIEDLGYTFVSAADLQPKEALNLAQ